VRAMLGCVPRSGDLCAARGVALIGGQPVLKAGLAPQQGQGFDSFTFRHLDLVAPRRTRLARKMNTDYFDGVFRPLPVFR
jgi:hypothetical protein